MKKAKDLTEEERKALKAKMVGERQWFRVKLHPDFVQAFRLWSRYMKRVCQAEECMGYHYPSEDLEAVMVRGLAMAAENDPMMDVETRVAIVKLLSFPENREEKEAQIRIQHEREERLKALINSVIPEGTNPDEIDQLVSTAIVGNA